MGFGVVRLRLWAFLLLVLLLVLVLVLLLTVVVVWWFLHSFLWKRPKLFWVFGSKETVFDFFACFLEERKRERREGAGCFLVWFWYHGSWNGIPIQDLYIYKYIIYFCFCGRGIRIMWGSIYWIGGLQIVSASALQAIVYSSQAISIHGEWDKRGPYPSIIVLSLNLNFNSWGILLIDDKKNGKQFIFYFEINLNIMTWLGIS